MAETLFLSHRIPFPPDRGDKIRSHHLLAGLAAQGPVHVATFAESASDRAQEGALAQISASHLLVNRSKSLALAGAEAILSARPVSLTAFDNARIRRWIAETLERNAIDTIVVFSGQMGQYIPTDFSGRVIIDLCDVDSVKFEAYAQAGDRVWLNRREGRLLAAEEERLAHRADVTLLISDNECDILRSRMKAMRAVDIRVLGNGIDADFFDPSQDMDSADFAADAAHFVFTGQMDYSPNVAAVERFATHILPLLRQGMDAHFHIVGRAPTARVTMLAQLDGVTVWGEVPDVRPFLAQASVVVAPIDIARGVQNKVLEAMAMARPVVLSRAAATGIAAEDGTHFAIADDDVQLTALCRRLGSDLAASTAMGDAARKFVIEQMGWDRVHSDLAQICRPGENARDAA